MPWAAFLLRRFLGHSTPPSCPAACGLGGGCSEGALPFLGGGGSPSCCPLLKTILLLLNSLH